MFMYDLKYVITFLYGSRSLLMTKFKLKREEAGSVLSDRETFKERLRKTYDEKGIQVTN